MVRVRVTLMAFVNVDVGAATAQLMMVDNISGQQI